MTTGNLRTATRAAFLAVTDREAADAEQARSFGAICLSFACGAASGGIATLHLRMPRHGWPRRCWPCASALIHAKQRAPQNDHEEIEKAAGDLLDRLDEQED